MKKHDVVKATNLYAYIPEVYRQKYSNKLLPERTVLFGWVTASKVTRVPSYIKWCYLSI